MEQGAFVMWPHHLFTIVARPVSAESTSLDTFLGKKWLFIDQFLPKNRDQPWRHPFSSKKWLSIDQFLPKNRHVADRSAT